MRSRNRRTAEELEALLEGRLPTDAAGPEARRLATLATTLVEERPGPVATLTEDRRLLMRDRLLDDIAALDAGTTTAPARRRRPTRTAIASGLASTMIAATGVTVAAQEALPGDALYGLKKGTESVRMNFASDATQAARLELRFAEERLEEITAGAPRLPSEALVAALAEMDQRSLAGAQQLVLAAEQEGEEELLAEIDAFLERQSAGLVEVFVRLPVEVRPHAEDSLAVLRRIRADLLQPALEACDCLDIVPASHGEGQFVRRTTSEPLPPAPRSEETTSEPEDATEDAAGVEAEGPDLSEPIDEITNGGTTTTDDTSGPVSDLLEPLGETGRKAGDTVNRTVDDVGETVDRTTEGVGDLLDKGGETVSRTTEGVGDTVDKATDAADDLLGSTTDGLLGR